MLQILYFLQPGKFKTYQMAFVGNIYHSHNICPICLVYHYLTIFFTTTQIFTLHTLSETSENPLQSQYNRHV